MKKNVLSFILITCLFTLISCNENNVNSNINNSSYSESIISSEEKSSEKNIVIKSHNNPTTNKSDELSSNSVSENDNCNTTISSNEKLISSSVTNSSLEYEILSTPSNKSNPLDITNWQNISFVDYLPSDFSYIYGNNKVNPDIYADGGGLVMDKNEGPRKGLQTPYFNTWNKIELRIQLGKFHGTSKSQNKNDPVFTIDCFDKSGSLIDTYYIEEIDVTDNSEVKTYIRNSSVCYLEIRATNLPIKANKVYNFGISGISLKGWIYD